MASDYKVLYRKYRPTSFDEMIGQKYTISMLKNAIVNDKISHAYIFTGPRGTGKTSTAKIFAKTINCEHPKDGIPCGECSSCLNINTNADIIEIDAASNNGVDEIRELINNVKIAPSFSKYKVYIIDEVHMLSQSAFNALLLTLEEPPSHIVFILATTNIESVPITILSRCQRYDFKKLDNNDLVAHLKSVCQKEEIQITDDAVQEIAYLSEGGCRDALSILNQLSTSNPTIDLDIVLNNYGSVSLIQIKNIVKYYIENNYEKLKEIFDNIEKSSIDYKVFIKKLIDQLFLEAIQFKSNHKNEQYLNIKSIIFALNDLMNKININIDPFLLIFLILIQFMDMKYDMNEAKVVECSNNNEEDSKMIDDTVVKLVEKMDEKTEEIQDNQEVLAVNENFNQYLNKIKEIRLNNCFAEADKCLLAPYKEKWKKFNKNISLIDAIKPIIVDSTVVLASPKINIIANAQQSIVELFNQELAKIEKAYEESIGEKIHFIALFIDDWEASKKEYIKRLKEHYVYQILEEPVFEEEKIERHSEDENEDYSSVLNIFDKNKVEIK